MKEVKAKRVAGPFTEVPFDNFIQSPIGLIPKAGSSDQTRSIFHLSYDFGDEDLSLNHHTPKEICSVKYNDIDCAIAQCLRVKKQGVQFNEITDEEPIYMGKSDIKSAFCLVPLSILCIQWLVMCAQNPVTKVWQYFIDKCLPFGASISLRSFRNFQTH